MTDPIADLLTRIRNANQAFHPKVDIPASKLKEGILKQMKKEGFIADYKFIPDHMQGILRVSLKYTPERKRVITGLKRVSKPGSRVYRKTGEIPRTLGGLGLTLLSTSRGLLSDKEARKEKVGGEVICQIW